MKPKFRRGLAALLCVLIAGQLPLFASASERSADISITEDMFPDPIFRQWLTNPSNLNGAGADAVLTQEELGEIRSIVVSNLGISSLEGIEVFYALEQLSCNDNALTELDVRQNRSLRYLQCDSNRISSLDVSGLDQLNALFCEHNHMTSINLAGCTALEIIYCRSNDLTSVDFSTNTNLKFIETFDNRLTEIDLSPLKKLEFVHLDHNRFKHLDLSHNPNLTGDGSGFVAKNNYLETLTLPNRPGQYVDWDVYLEQNPQTGHDRVEWYYDSQYTNPVEELTPADGRTLFAKWLPNDYTIRFDAGGGFGSMASVAAVWDTPVTLPAQTFRRTGYTFRHWESSINGKTYPDEAQVTNLSGKTQDSRVTLYARWTPITYTVAFNAGMGSGSMEPTTYTYDQEKALPSCTLTAPAGLEFVGWARKASGPVVFRNQDPIQNLSSNQDEVVTLYAVWGTPVLNQYLARLDKIYSRYDSSDYTAQDWNTLEALYHQATQDLVAAGNEDAMVRICADAEQAMAGVSTLPQRTQTVLNLWQQSNQEVLDLVDRGAVQESNAQLLFTAARDAGDALSADFVAQHTDLTIPADQTLLAQLARNTAQSQLSGLDRLAAAAEWAAALDGLSLRPMSEVTSQTVSAYQTAVANANDYTAQLHEDLTRSLQDRAALALCKQQSTDALRTAYQGYDLTQYSESARAQLESIWSQATRSMESAASESNVIALLDAALKDLLSVPVQTQPGGGSGGDSGETGGGDTGSGGSGGESGGSSGGSGGGSSGGGGGSSSGGGGGSTEKPVTPPDTPEQQPTWENPYTDVASDAWYYASVEYVSSNGIMNGYADGTFGPDRKLSRAHLAQLLYNLENRPDTAHARYPDMEAGAWYETAISWATEVGILTGYDDGSVRPNASITRQQLAAMLYRYAQYKGHDVTQQADLSGYRDAAQIAPYALDAMQWANAAGILNGSEDALLPGNTATRAQTAAMLTRFCTGES